MTLTNFYRRLLVQVVIAVATIVVLAAAVVILNIHTTKQAADIRAQKNEIALRNRMVELLAGGNSDLKRAEPLLTWLETVLPGENDLLSFRRKMNNVYPKEFGVTAGFEYGEQKKATGQSPGSIHFDLSTSGTYDALVGFIKFLEAHPYFIHFDNITVNYQLEDKYNLTTNGLIYTK